MPLTAYSISEGKELDVEQLLLALSARRGISAPTSTEHIPDSWREHIRVDIECPSCFITGAEIVKEASSRTTGKKVRQACFRFVSPGHRTQCDFASDDASNLTPETAVQFGAANSALTKAIRDLVCAGIYKAVFDQRSIRDMREWFFNKKLESTFLVSLDPRLPKWVNNLARLDLGTSGQLPESVALTAEIALMPGFDWKAEATRILLQRHRHAYEAIRQNRLWTFPVADRVESLAKRYQGQLVFDPTALMHEYCLSVSLAAFILHNHAPISRIRRKPGTEVPTHLLAFSALLLFVNAWDMSRAVDDFVIISASLGQADNDLGNVIGLNPFHDYGAWEKLKQLQAASLNVPLDVDPLTERQTLEQELRVRFQG